MKTHVDFVFKPTGEIRKLRSHYEYGLLPARSEDNHFIKFVSLQDCDPKKEYPIYTIDTTESNEYEMDKNDENLCIKMHPILRKYLCKQIELILGHPDEGPDKNKYIVVLNILFRVYSNNKEYDIDACFAKKIIDEFFEF